MARSPFRPCTDNALSYKLSALALELDASSVDTPIASVVCRDKVRHVRDRTRVEAFAPDRPVESVHHLKAASEILPSTATTEYVSAAGGELASSALKEAATSCLDSASSISSTPCSCVVCRSSSEHSTLKRDESQ